ncbi:TetR/AcrR family transcriptional regulator [Peribacillus muralis]|uniref:TetR/AcrR family transcriptional regulator n=1 Tax=Peribacillus muralis TaxID=264697 RepID=UPI003670E70E
MSREKKKSEMTKTIIETAKRLFNDHGVEQVSMYMIAQEVGIGQGTLYRRFSNKAELCMTILSTDFQALFQRIERYMQQNASCSSYEKGKYMILEMIRMNAEHSSWIEVIFSQSDFKEIHHQEKFSKVPAPFIAVQHMLEPLFKVTDDMEDPFFRSTILAWSLNPILIRTFSEKGYSEEQIAEQFAQVFLRGDDR